MADHARRRAAGQAAGARWGAGRGGCDPRQPDGAVDQTGCAWPRWRARRGDLRLVAGWRSARCSTPARSRSICRASWPAHWPCDRPQIDRTIRRCGPQPRHDRIATGARSSRSPSRMVGHSKKPARRPLGKVEPQAQRERYRSRPLTRAAAGWVILVTALPAIDWMREDVLAARPLRARVKLAFRQLTIGDRSATAAGH